MYGAIDPPRARGKIEKKAAGYLSSALQVLSWHGQGGHKHGKAAKQEHSAHQATEPSQKYRPVNRVTKKGERSEKKNKANPRHQMFP